MGRTVGLDVGDSRIGVALSDPLGVLASPLTIIDRRDIDADVGAVMAVVRQYEVAAAKAPRPKKRAISPPRFPAVPTSPSGSRTNASRP
jgi:hypothetical protein